LKSFQRLILATVSLLTFAAPALSNSVVTLTATPKSEQGSIIYRGEPLDCSVDVCPAPEPVVEGVAPTSGAMVDAFGMPTKMPTILRGGQSDEDKVIMAPKETAAAPAAVTPAAPAKTGEKPAETAPAPAPVAEAPAKPSAPAASPTPAVE
jgi:hypothetical protein